MTDVEKKIDIISPDIAKTLHELFVERVRHTPKNVAYRYFNRTTKTWKSSSWEETLQEIEQWKSALANEPLHPGDKVAIMLPNSFEWVVMEQAALSLGLVVVPLFTNDRADNVAYILQDAGVKILLVDGIEHLQQLKSIYSQLDGLVRLLTVRSCHDTDIFSRYKYIGDWLKESHDKVTRTPELDTNNLASIVYTSGTTGRPKGVMLSHRNILHNTYAGLQSVTVYTDDTFLSFLPLSHMLERMAGYYLPMMAGATVAFARSVSDLAEDLIHIKPTVLISVPRIYERVHAKINAQMEHKSNVAKNLFSMAVEVGWKRFEYQQKRGAWNSSFLLWPILNKLVAAKIMHKLGGRLRIAICGGAPLSTSVAKTFIGLGLNLLQGYGLTETSPVISVNKPDDNDPSSVGVALSDIDVRVAENGELLTKSDSVMLGYWHNAKATKEIIDTDGWLHTGDKATIENNHIYITGRLKEIIVLSNGEKIAPADMEMAITADPLFEQALLVGEGRPYLSALVVLSPEHWDRLAVELEVSKNESSLKEKKVTTVILERIRSKVHHFPGYAQIHRVAVYLQPWTIEDGLMTPTLKLRRERIIAQHKDTIDILYHGH